MHQAKSGRCRFVDQDLGRIAQLDHKRFCGGSGACQGTPHKEGKEGDVALEKFIAEGNEKADELAKAGARLDEGYMAEARAETMQQKREEVYAALQYAASFHCLV